MSRKCPHCNTTIVNKPISKLPLYKEVEPYNFMGKDYTTKFNWEALKWSNLNLMNLIFGDWINLAIILSVLFMAVAYGHDSEVYREIYSNPCDYVKQNSRACFLFEEQNKSNLMIMPDLSISLYNFTMLNLSKDES